MFVPFNSSPLAQPLKPHCTLKQSASCVTINTYTLFEPPNSPAPSTPSRAVEILRDKWGDLSSPHSDRESSPYSNARTRGQFKPQRTGKGTSSFQLRQFAEATLGTGSLRKVVKLPEGEDLNEWLAVNGETSTLALILEYMLTLSSRRLLQPHQPHLRLNNRILLTAVMPRDEGDRRVILPPLRTSLALQYLTISQDSNISGKTPQPATQNPPRCPRPNTLSTS